MVRCAYLSRRCEPQLAQGPWEWARAALTRTQVFLGYTWFFAGIPGFYPEGVSTHNTVLNGVLTLVLGLPFNCVNTDLCAKCWHDL